MEERAEIMTDYQMRTMINMIVEIVMKGKDKREIVTRLLAIRDGNLDFDDLDLDKLRDDKAGD